MYIGVGVSSDKPLDGSMNSPESVLTAKQDCAVNCHVICVCVTRFYIFLGVFGGRGQFSMKHIIGFSLSL